MKISFGKRLGTIALVLILLIGFMPFSARANVICANGQHTPDTSVLYPADWNNQTGGYGYDYYKCTKCGCACDASGYDCMYVGPNNGCSGGQKCHVLGNPFNTLCNGSFTGTLYYCAACNLMVDADGTIADLSVLNGHTPGTVQYPANYAVCTGGYTSNYYLCTVCNQPTDANGNGIVLSDPSGPHTPGSTLYPADWNDQTGGYGYDYYKCTVCGCSCDENGHVHVFVGPDNGCSGGYKCHKPGTVQYPADYTPCQGGFKVPYYLCTACNNPVDANGTLVDWSAPTGSHTPGAEKHDANYTPCQGGFTVDFYECTGCGCPVDADGNEPTYTPGNGVHDLEQVPGKAPTYEEDGYTAFWKCKDCSAAFKDEAGTLFIEDIEEILLPKIEKTEEPQHVEISNGLQEVPQGITNQYASVDAVYKALVNAAVVSDASLNAENTKNVLLDVELQVQNPDGIWTAVTPENFPTGGVEVLLPYPEGTNPNDYTFVITHMLTSGSRAGEIEVLQGTLEQDGIRVRFTSMSPVVIAYQAKEAGNKTPTPQTGYTGHIVLWTILLLSSGVGLLCLTRKKKAQ